METFHAPHLLALFLQSEGIKAVTAAFAKEGVPLRFVGGAVRDALLERSITDIDLATPIIPEETMALLAKHGLKPVPTGLKHGTITVYFHGQPVEITTLRRDIACDGRWATVEFTDDWQMDAARRDFTMNALSCGLDGIVYDYFTGLEDLRQGVVRFVGDAQARIQEDVLRILRFFRFFAYYGKALPAPETLAACSQNAPSLAMLSAERVQSEMLKILNAKDPATIVQFMQEQGVLPVIFPCEPNIRALSALVKFEQEHGMAQEALRRLAALVQGEQPSERVVALLARQWKLSGKQRQFLHAVLSPEAHIAADASLQTQKHLLRLWGRERFRDIALLSAVMQQDDSGLVDRLHLANTWEAPIFPVSGADLLSVGIPQGKQLGVTLKALENWWEQGGYSASKEILLKRVQYPNPLPEGEG